MSRPSQRSLTACLVLWIVALTSSTMRGDEERFIAEGFDGYMQKPISVREFPDQVRAHLRA